MARSAEARKVLRELDNELAAASARRGEKLVWTAAERAVLGLISAQIDRKVWLSRAWARTDDLKLRVKLNAELRLAESHLARLLLKVTPDVPAAESLRTVKARRAARARWNRGTDAAG